RRGSQMSEPALINAKESFDQHYTPLSDRDEAACVARLCLEFELRHSEARMFVRLLMPAYSTREELRAAARQEDEAITLGTVSVVVSKLRKKLRPHDIHVTTIPGLGYALDRKVREKIRKLLAKHDGEIVALTDVASRCA